MIDVICEESKPRGRFFGFYLGFTSLYLSLTLGIPRLKIGTYFWSQNKVLSMIQCYCIPFYESNFRSCLKMPQKCHSIKIPQKNQHSLAKNTKISLQNLRSTSQASMIIFQIFPKYLLKHVFRYHYCVFWDIIQDIQHDVYQMSTHKEMRSNFSYISGVKFIVCAYFWLLMF